LNTTTCSCGCAAGQTLCNGTCVTNGTSACNNTCCGPGASCCGTGGSAGCCPAGQICCTNPTTGTGSCCGVGLTCVSGTCQCCSAKGCTTCGVGQECAAGACVTGCNSPGGCHQNLCPGTTNCYCIQTTEGLSVCSIDAVCLKQVNCTSNLDCAPLGATCQNGVCLIACTNNGSCPGVGVCHNGFCTNCSVSSECPPGWFCAPQATACQSGCLGATACAVPCP
jgi:hypothetical protein